MPQLNVKGESIVPTCSGGLVTLLVMLITILFTLLKLEHMLRRNNPSITKFDDASDFYLGEKFDLTEGKNNQMAFAIENSSTGLKYDDRFFKIVAKRVS